MKNYPDIGVQSPDICLPKKGVDLTKWAVIACDQFTSEPGYWQQVEKIVGGEPSTYHLILPEVYLEKPGEESRVRDIQAAMHSYLERRVLDVHAGMIYVERQVSGRTRKGIVLCLDLERYDFNKGSASLIRSTEGTIIERLPPRMKIRQGAELELPHILVLIDDPENQVIEPISAQKDSLEKLYDFELMLDSGHLRGYSLTDPIEGRVVKALRSLAQPEIFASKYGIRADHPVLLFAMGDGNHSLATAKSVWEQMKAKVGADHPARYALVEIENVHDPALEFEPIHRILFGVKRSLIDSMKSYFHKDFSFMPVAGSDQMVEQVDHGQGPEHRIGVVDQGRFGVITVAHPTFNLPVGTLQTFLDGFMKEDGAEKIDYVHGSDVVCRLGAERGNTGFYIPGMSKSDLFKTVILDGALPRKTFSMGTAREKRFYMECRKIS